MLYDAAVSDPFDFPTSGAPSRPHTVKLARPQVTNTAILGLRAPLGDYRHLQSARDEAPTSSPQAGGLNNSFIRAVHILNDCLSG